MYEARNGVDRHYTAHQMRLGCPTHGALIARNLYPIRRMAFGRNSAHFSHHQGLFGIYHDAVGGYETRRERRYLGIERQAVRCNQKIIASLEMACAGKGGRIALFCRHGPQWFVIDGSSVTRNKSQCEQYQNKDYVSPHHRRAFRIVGNRTTDGNAARRPFANTEVRADNDGYADGGCKPRDCSVHSVCKS